MFIGNHIGSVRYLNMLLTTDYQMVTLAFAVNVCCQQFLFFSLKNKFGNVFITVLLSHALTTLCHNPKLQKWYIKCNMRKIKNIYS